MSLDGSPTQSSVSQTQGSAPSQSPFLTKSQAVQQLLKKLSSKPDGEFRDTEPISEDEHWAAYDDYFEQLEGIDADRRIVRDESGRPAADNGSIGTGDRGDRAVREASNLIGEDQPRSPSLKQHRTDDDESEECTKSPKRPINPSLFPFRQDIISAPLDEELRLTLELKANYVRDVKFIKSEIASQPDLPDIPPAVWDDLIRSAYIDFDKIVTSHYTLEGDPREARQLGDFEADWSLAWNKYKQGVLYLYRHRGLELQTYDEYILGQFTATSADTVINFDKAVHSRVGRQNNVKLSDFRKFNDLFTSQIVIPASREGLAFVKEQCRQEERLGRFLAPFKDLLPGMYSMPIHAVPKPHTDSFQMVVDHSVGNYSLNSLIDRDAVGMRLDNVQDLACNLLSCRSEVGDAPIWLFKSDILQAYRWLPMHPLWQIKQVVTVDGKHRVDQCNNFGDRAGGFIWCSFFGLVLWIAINIRRILELLAYVDDTFGHDAQAELVCYKPYDAYYPAKQVCLLELWDFLGIPHEKKKQEFGRTLTIIGFQVDTQAMTISLDPDARRKLVNAVRSFMHDAPKRRHKLVEWLRVLGYANWGLNVAPLLRPALQSAWEKTHALTVLSALIYATTLDPPPTTLAIFTDNLNTVQIFESMPNGNSTPVCSRIAYLSLHTPTGCAGGYLDMLEIDSTSWQPARSPWTYEHLVRERAIALSSDLDKSTHASYNSHLQSYLTFCKMHAFPIAPSEDTLSFYIVYMSHHIQPNSVATYLSGICNRCVKLYKTPTNRKRPLSVEDLSYVTSLCPHPSHDDKLFHALLHCGFFALHRLGELVMPDRVALRDWRRVIKRSTVMAYTSGFGYHLPYHKGDQFFEGSTVIILSQDEANPLPIFNAYLSSRDSLFHLHPALWLTSTGAPPTRAWFLRCLRAIFPMDIAGHSLCSGGVTHFAAASWPDEHIQALGHWTSQAFKIYIRKNPIILQALVHGQTIAERDSARLPQ
ncbi:hypothetical protein EW146_g3442 [Bondarzewia mesenterica]|uniref:Reverse transcriptase domain-containing protein n=1 Tax=Bondarzewia mesenterica TaxID=1095465 RepID=A0A4V3XFF8_9AGAM|nr:hypothetical protein EW146_g3442 [Bondarzewia mesenterica]